MAKLVSKIYSNALFEIAIESNLLDEILSEYKFVKDSLIEYSSFEEIITSPKVSLEDKKRIVDETFGEKISKSLLSFLKLLIDKKRESYIKEIYKEFKKLSDDHKGLIVAKVESVISLDKSEITALEKKLSDLTNATVTVKNVINPDIIGGLVVKVGDKIIDGSVKNKLENLKHDLTQIVI